MKKKKLKAIHYNGKLTKTNECKKQENRKIKIKNSTKKTVGSFKPSI